MKKLSRMQQFRLPFIQQNINLSHNKLSKSNTKRSCISVNSSQINSVQKQKNVSKPSKFQQLHDLKLKAHNKSQVHKKFNKNTFDSRSQTLSDFEQKIKENKRLLKKHKLKRQLQKQTKSISKRLDKHNLSELDKLPEIKSKKVLKPKRPNKKYITSLANTDPKQWIDTIMKGNDMNIAKQIGPKDHLKRLNDKIKGNDVFENIHTLLTGLQSDVQLEVKVPSREEIYHKILNFTEKLKKVDPDSQFLRTLDRNMQRKASLPFLMKNNSSSTNASYNTTASQWSKISLDNKQIIKLSSSFDQEAQKINFYLGRTESCLDELLKNKMSILDLLLVKKIKLKENQLKKYQSSV